MSLDVTSWFVQAGQHSLVQPRRRFTLAGSDFSGHVLRWPALRARADAPLELGDVALELANADLALNALLSNDVLLASSCELALGFTHPLSGTEYATLYRGTPTGVQFRAGGTAVSLRLRGVTRGLSHRALGSEVRSAGLDFTTSAHLAADLAWTLATCYGGLSASASSANPDIAYAEWAAWRAADAVRDLRVRAYFTGQRPAQAISELALMTSRIVTMQGRRLRFRDRFQPFGAATDALPAERIAPPELELDAARIVNEYVGEADYDRATGRYLSSFSRVNSRSRVDYGVRSGRFSSRGVWFDSPADGRYLAQDQVYFQARPRADLRVSGPLALGVHRTPGDVLTVTDSRLGLGAVPYRIEEQALDLQSGELELTLRRAEHRPWELVGQAASVSVDPRWITAVGSNAFRALDDAGVARRLYGSAGGAAFAPMPLFGTALLALSATELLVAGPSSAGSTQAVIQRSSDAGSSAVVVSALASNAHTVHDLFRLPSGTLLASTNSDGIWRSTDAGSSWSLTQTISGAYHVARFFSPYAGEVWGGTGQSDPLLADALWLWRSTNDGASWAPTHAVVSGPAGDYVTAGLHALSATEFLLAHYGTTAGERAVRRGVQTSPTSIAWSVAAAGASFSHVVGTTSGHLLFGWHEGATLSGGSVWRSTNAGAAWEDEWAIAKRGNVRVLDNGDGTLEAFVARTSAGALTYRYRTYEPNRIG